mgnify:FL=1
MVLQFWDSEKSRQGALVGVSGTPVEGEDELRLQIW